MKHVSKRVLLHKLAALYEKMGQAYAQAAPEGFTCQGCTTNCCVSYFQHHTYLEWLYLWEGLAALPDARREAYVSRAKDNVAACRQALDQGQPPKVMCPVNDDGACGLYQHRLMICRLFGVPNVLLTPQGLRRFPGCPVCMELVSGKPDAPGMDRTAIYRELAELEMTLLGSKRGKLPKVDMTLSEMIVAGPPKV